MKTNVKKSLLLVLCAVLLVVATVFATVAYFSSKADVQNTFTVGKVEISLDETKVDKTGTPVTPAAKTTTGNEYLLVPAATYTKDPVVHVEADSENSWVFVKVTNGIADIEAAETASNKKIATQITANGWTALPGVAGVYYKEYTKSASVVDYKVFENFTVSSAADKTSLASYSAVTVDVDAYAIQKTGLTTAAAAWAEVSK